MRVARLSPLGSLALGLLAACGSDEPEWRDVRVPEEYEQDLGRSETAALAVEADLRAELLQPLMAGDRSRAQQAFTEQAQVRTFTALEAEPSAHGRVVPVEVEPSGQVDSALNLTAQLVGLSLGGHCARGEVELDRFWLGDTFAAGRFELRLGWESSPGDARTWRNDARLTFLAEFVLVGSRWRIDRCDFVEGTYVTGPGPRLVEVTAQTGLHYGVSPRNREMLQNFADQHQTLALGGLSAVDWEDDGDWDLLATRRGQLALLFENDGRGGFLPRPLPMASPRECGSFLLHVDLDGDGVKELVGSEPLGFEGDRAWCGIWRLVDGAWQLDERALTFPNPAGLRRLSIQTVVPCDVQGDGRLDLFFAVYGSALSRGEDYNTVDAYDGADNHLFIQQADGSFEEVSDAAGITGTQYTYIAEAFDFDGDGDADLFEGNDFGPNILWRNEGDGTFVADAQLGLDSVPAYTMGVTLADFDNSGRWSLYVSNMSSEQGKRIVPITRGLDSDHRDMVAVIAGGNHCYTQDPATGRWEEHAADLGIDEGEWAWGCQFFDADNDGYQDLVVTNGFTSHSDRGQPDWQSWYWRQVVADADFLQRGARRRDVNQGEYRPSSFNGYERDRLFVQSPAHGRFFEAGWVLGFDEEHDGRCVVPVDVDGDGDLDLALWTLQGLKLFENQNDPRPFLRLRLRATRGHPSALGAVVEVNAGGKTRRARMRLTEGFQSQVPSDLHFGLGGEALVEEVLVRWPSGAVDTYRGLPLDRRVTLTEGDAHPLVEALAAWPEATRPRTAEAPTLDRFLDSVFGGSASLEAPGQIVVLHVPVSAESIDELAPLASSEVALRVVLPPGLSKPGALFPWPAFLMDEELQASLFPDGGAPPATFVLDREGRHRRTFRRTIQRSELEAVLATLEDEPPFAELLVMSGREALRDGRLRLALQYFTEALEQDGRRADACEGLGRCHMLAERPDLAQSAYQQAVAIDPDYAIGHYNLAVSLVQQGRPAQALAPFAESLRITGDEHGTLMSLAEAAYLAKRHDAALDAWRRAADLDGEDLEPRLNRAKLLGQLRRLDEAEQAFQEVLAIRADDQEAKQGLQRVKALRARSGD